MDLSGTWRRVQESFSRTLAERIRVWSPWCLAGTPFQLTDVETVETDLAVSHALLLGGLRQAADGPVRQPLEHRIGGNPSLNLTGLTDVFPSS